MRWWNEAECRQLLGGVVIVQILAAVVAQQFIGRHSWVISDKFWRSSFSRIITTKFLWQIAARTVSNKGKVPKGSRSIPLLKVLLQVMTKRDQFVMVKKKKKAKIVLQ